MRRCNWQGIVKCCTIMVLMCTLAGVVYGQPSSSRSLKGLQVQVYPAGVIGNAQFTQIFSQKQTLGLHAGFNATNRRDWGKHDDETGNGAGAGFSWQYYLNQAPGGFHLGLRTDLWFMGIDWKQNTGETGSTNITVFQPTIQLGYTHVLSRSPLTFDASVSLGAEINAKTKGEPVGEGAILLVGVGLFF